MKTRLAPIAAMLCLSGCVGADVVSSVSPSSGAPQFGYPRIEQAALPVLPSPEAPAHPSPAVHTATTSTPVQPPAPPLGQVQAQAVYDETRDPTFAPLLANVGKAEAMPDLPLNASGGMKLPPSPKLDVIDIADTRASLRSED